MSATCAVCCQVRQPKGTAGCGNARSRSSGSWPTTRTIPTCASGSAARIAARLDSPHVVPIHDFGVIEERMFIDMRLVRGRDLGALIAAEGPLPAERAVGNRVPGADNSS